MSRITTDLLQIWRYPVIDGPVLQCLFMINNLQLLRMIAASMVLLCHLSETFRQGLPVGDVFNLGAAGVDIFFVLSGVVITLAEHNRTTRPDTFLARRVLRVAPMYWLALALMSVTLLAGLAPLGVQSQDATLLNMFKSMAFVPFERAHGVMMPLIGVGWTLNYEMFFYTIFAVMLFLPRSMRLHAVVTVIIALVGLGQVWTPANAITAFYTNPILLEFAAGVGLAALWLYAPHLTLLQYRLGGGLCLAVGLGLFVLLARPDEISQFMVDRVIVFGIPAVFCVAGAMLLERGGVYVRRNFWMLLGAASYALYLFHSFVVQFLDKAAQALGLVPSSPAMAVAMMIVGFVGAHCVAVALHVRVERSLTRWLIRLQESLRDRLSVQQFQTAPNGPDHKAFRR